MRIVALEEHYTVPRLVAGISPDVVAQRGFPAIQISAGRRHSSGTNWPNLGPARLTGHGMKAASLRAGALQSPGRVPISCRVEAGIDLARRLQRRPGRSLRAPPTRYRGFAHLLPCLAPEAAATEAGDARSLQLGFHGVHW